MSSIGAVPIRIVWPSCSTRRAARTSVTHRQKSLQVPRAVVGEQNQLSEQQQAASDETRCRLHSALVQSDAPVQAPCPVLLSAAGKARNPGGLNTVLESYKDQPADQLLPLHGGLPHPDAFPLSGLSLRLKNGQTLHIDDAELVRPLPPTPSPACFQTTHFDMLGISGRRCATVRHSSAGGNLLQCITSKLLQTSHKASISI